MPALLGPTWVRNRSSLHLVLRSPQTRARSVPLATSRRTMARPRARRTWVGGPLPGRPRRWQGGSTHGGGLVVSYDVPLGAVPLLSCDLNQMAPGTGNTLCTNCDANQYAFPGGANAGLGPRSAPPPLLDVCTSLTRARQIGAECPLPRVSAASCSQLPVCTLSNYFVVRNTCQPVGTQPDRVSTVVSPVRWTYSHGYR